MHEAQILLVDDHQLVRAGLRSLLESIPAVKVVAEASDGRQALGMIAQYRPEIVLLDIAMPKLSGLETLVRIRRQFPNTKVIILSMHANTEFIVQALSSERGRLRPQGSGNG